MRPSEKRAWTSKRWPRRMWESWNGYEAKAPKIRFQKLLADVLKECSRMLDPPRGGNAGVSEQPTLVELHHDIPRPVRDEFPESDGGPGL